jgi:hypothetical protein
MAKIKCRHCENGKVYERYDSSGENGNYEVYKCLRCNGTGINKKPTSPRPEPPKGQSVPDSDFRLSLSQIDKMKHVLGNVKKLYRNYYCSGQIPDLDWEDLVRVDLAYKTVEDKENGGIFYRLTPLGITTIKHIVLGG